MKPIPMDARHLIRGADVDLPPLRRPGHWLPGEPLVVLHDDAGDAFHEVTLELGGRVVATRVVSDDASLWMMFRDFQGIIKQACAGDT